MVHYQCPLDGAFKVPIDKKASVMHSVEKIGKFQTNQGEVWEERGTRMYNLEVHSPTSAMRDIYEKEKNRIDDYKEIFKIVEGQIGAVFAAGKIIFGMDAFDKEDTCKKLMPKIIKSYIMEILSGGKTEKKPETKDVKEFLKAVVESQFSSRKSPGAGMTVSIRGKEVAGTLLVAKDTVVHTAIFNKPEQEQQKDEYSYLRHPSARRDYRIIREE